MFGTRDMAEICKIKTKTPPESTGREGDGCAYVCVCVWFVLCVSMCVSTPSKRHTTSTQGHCDASGLVGSSSEETEDVNKALG